MEIQNIAQFLTARSVRTTERYIYHLSKIPPEKLENLNSPEDLYNLYVWFTEQEGKQPYSYIKNYRQLYYALKIYLKANNKSHLLPYIPKDALPKKKNKNEIKYLEHHVIEELIKNADRKLVNRNQKEYRIHGSIMQKPEPDRDRDPLFIEFLFKTGMRVGEALTIRPIDINFKDNEIYLKEGKTGGRTVLFDNEIKEKLKRYIEKYKIKDKQVIFDFKPNINQEKLKNIVGMFPKNKQREARKKYILYRNIQRAEYMIKQVGKLVVTQKTITPHQMRHSLAIFLRKNKNMPLDAVQVILGHTDISTTGKFYAKIDIKDVKDDYLKAIKNK